MIYPEVRGSAESIGRCLGPRQNTGAGVTPEPHGSDTVHPVDINVTTSQDRHETELE